MILANTAVVNAADATVTLKPSKTQLYPGDTFTVTVNAKCDEGIDGIHGGLAYDKTKLELVKIDIDTLKWGLINEETEEGLDLGVVGNSTSKITEADILTITFKVKNTVVESSKLKIKLLDTILGADVESEEEAEIKIGTEEIEVSIIKEQANPNPGDNPGNNPNENPGDEPTETPEENPGNEPSETPEEKPGNSQDKSDKELEKDDTKSENELPKTGCYTEIGIMIVVAIFGTMCLVRYNKYK